jgi:hypothetical protein
MHELDSITPVLVCIALLALLAWALGAGTGPKK